MSYMEKPRPPARFLISKKIKLQSPTNQKYFYICFKNNKKQNDDI